jgi:hypothetical protein
MSPRSARHAVLSEISPFESDGDVRIVIETPRGKAEQKEKGEGRTRNDRLIAIATHAQFMHESRGPLRPGYDFRKAQDVKVTGTLILPS